MKYCTEKSGQGERLRGNSGYQDINWKILDKWINCKIINGKHKYSGVAYIIEYT